MWEVWIWRAEEMDVFGNSFLIKMAKLFDSTIRSLALL